MRINSGLGLSKLELPNRLRWPVSTVPTKAGLSWVTSKVNQIQFNKELVAII